MNKAFDENRTSYYRLHVSAGPISNRSQKQTDLIAWMVDSKFNGKAKIFSLGKIDEDEYIIFIQSDSPEVMTEVAKKFDVFKFNPSQNDLDKAYLVMG